MRGTQYDQEGPDPTTKELWRCEYSLTAYRDQTGKPQNGYIVHAQVMVKATGETFEFVEGCAGTTSTGRIWIDPAGNEYRSHPPCDYGASTTWSDDQHRSWKAIWRPRPPGYVWPNGQPVEALAYSEHVLPDVRGNAES